MKKLTLVVLALSLSSLLNVAYADSKSEASINYTVSHDCPYYPICKDVFKIG
jgi:hypothetical protein